MIGRSLAHYEITDEIGKGGMGEVFLAYDTKLQRTVAIKTLRADLEIPGGRARFRREALALSQLNHPSIATIHDFGRDDGLDYLVMEFVEGETLAERLQSGPLARDEVLRLGIQLGEGLRVAHEHGVVHRDLKPANLKITPDGRLKILDFGLAKRVGPVADGDHTTEQLLTEGPVGTLPYMAPEQLRSEEPDPRTDLHATGAILYELSTGRRPYHEKGGAELAAAILSEPPDPPSQVRQGLDPNLEAVILRSLEKGRDQRYQTATELLEDLERIVAGSEARQRMERRRRRRALSALVTAILLATAGALALDLGGLRRWVQDHLLPGTPPIHSVAVLPLTNLTQDPQQDVFVNGMTEELITNLQRMQALERVVSPRTVMRYKDSQQDPVEIAEELDVDAIVEGSYQRTGDQVRVNLRIVHAGPNIDLWADSFQRSLRDVLALHGELASAIAEQIGLVLDPEVEEALQIEREVDPLAYRELLMGRSEARIGTAASHRRAIEHFDAAVAIDSTYADAFAGKAISYSWVVAQNGVADTTRHEEARFAARRALELSPESPWPHVAMAHVHFWLDLRVGAAEAEFRRALELDPADPWVRHHAAIFWTFIGQHEKAIQEAERAYARAPLDAAAARTLAWVYYATGQHEKAIAQLEKSLELPSRFLSEEEAGWARTQIAWNLFHLGRWEDVKSMMDRGEFSAGLYDSCVVFLALGDSSLARDALAAGRLPSTEFEQPAFMAGHLGDPEPYFAKLDDFYQDQSCRIYWQFGSEVPSVVRTDPRYGEWLERLGLSR